MTDSPMVNEHAEQAVLGALLLDPSLLASVSSLRPGDFHNPTHALILTAILDTVSTADGKVDTIAVLETLRTRGEVERVGGAPYLHTLMQSCPVATQAPYYGRIVQQAARRRDLLLTARRLVQAAEHPDTDTALDTVSDLIVTLSAQLDTPTDDDPITDLHEFGAFVERGRDIPTRWVVPGLIAPMDRAVIVAGEGAGKTTWARQIAIATGQGRHPMNPAVRIPAQRVLMVDLENSPDDIASQGRPLVDTVKAGGGWISENVWLWSRPGGINVRKYSDVALLDRVMTRVRPSLMCLGPLYKASLDGSDRGEQVASEVAAALDKLREKHRCALWLEHHAPMAQGGARDLRPVNSGLWMRWPEFGRTLQKDPEDRTGRVFLVGAFRPDRARGRCWPDWMTWGRSWPWECGWADGMPDAVRAEGAA